MLLPVLSQKALLAGKTDHLGQEGIYFLKILTTWKAADDLPKVAKDEDLFEDKYTILGSVTQGIVCFEVVLQFLCKTIFQNSGEFCPNLSFLVSDQFYLVIIVLYCYSQQKKSKS